MWDRYENYQHIIIRYTIIQYVKQLMRNKIQDILCVVFDNCMYLQDYISIVTGREKFQLYFAACWTWHPLHFCESKVKILQSICSKWEIYRSAILLIISHRLIPMSLSSNVKGILLLRWFSENCTLSNFYLKKKKSHSECTVQFFLEYSIFFANIIGTADNSNDW